MIWLQKLLVTELPPVHVHPCSTVHVELHPSPFTLLLSSHYCSNLFPSPQIYEQLLFIDEEISLKPSMHYWQILDEEQDEQYVGHTLQIDPSR